MGQAVKVTKRIRNSFAELRQIFLRSSLLSTGLMFALMPQAFAACVETSNSTQCSNDSGSVDIVAPNASYVAGDFIVGFDSFKLLGGGLGLTGINGKSSVTLSNGSIIDGGVFGSFTDSAIFLNSSSSQAIDVSLSDSSSVHSVGNGIEARSSSFSSTASVAITTQQGSV